VWPAHHLNDIITTLHDVAIDLMILDLDQQRLDELSAFANRWRGVKILFQASSPELAQDFRCWMADQLVIKFHNGENISHAVAQLLRDSPRKRRKTVSVKKSLLTRERNGLN
jgi:hypothetical protein